MGVEELIKTLRDGGLDDEAIKKLLSDALASLEGPAEDEVAEKEEAGRYLGVEL